MANQYANELKPEQYQHRFHAGNVGDVWKHSVLLLALRAFQRQHPKALFLDCYAGAGEYHLSGSGEWNEGIDALLKFAPAKASAALSLYIGSCLSSLQDSRRYPGSPALLAQQLRKSDQLICCETDQSAFTELQKVLPKIAQCLNQNGLEALQSYSSKKGPLLALIDPPWVKKQDWQEIPQALIQAWQNNPQALFILWYPIKSYTRINAMLKTFEAAKVPGLVLDLITTALEFQRNRLNGSGLFIVNAPEDLAAQAAEAATIIGQACATNGKYWSLRLTQLA